MKLGDFGRHMGKVGAILAAVTGPAQAQAPKDGIEYVGKEAKVMVTPDAKKILEDNGYSFPMKDGKLTWCLRGKECTDFDVSPNDAYKGIALDFRDIDTPAGKKVLLCRGVAWPDGRPDFTFYMFDPRFIDNQPFRGIPPSDDIVKTCFPDQFWKNLQKK